MKKQIAAVIALACTLSMTASAAEFTGRMFWAVWRSWTDCDLFAGSLDEWDGTHKFDEYMEVGGKKYPARAYSPEFPDFLFVEVKIASGETFTPLVLNGTTSGEVSLEVLSNTRFYNDFASSEDEGTRRWWLDYAANYGSYSRAWIKIKAGKSNTALRAHVDVSKRRAAGVYSNYTMSELAASCGIDFFTGVYDVAPSTWYEIGIKETGEVFKPTQHGIDTTRLYISQQAYCQSFVALAPYEDYMEERMGINRVEAMICPAAWYVSAREAGGAELVLRANDIRKGTVSGNGIYAPNTQVTVRAEPYEGYLFAGWYHADGGQMLSSSTTFTYATTDADTTIVARFVDSTYKIVFEPGSDEVDPSMPEQSVEPGKVAKLNPCAFAAPAGKKFAGWRRNDNGRRYDDGVMVFDLAESGETVKLTAIWE